jgi:hypothetical protein
MIINWNEKLPFTILISFITFVISYFLLIIIQPDSVTRIDDENKRKIVSNKIITLSLIICISIFVITYIFYK